MYFNAIYKIYYRTRFLWISDPMEKTRETVAGISESVCRPLKARIEQMIVSGQGRDSNIQKPVQLYKISSLLHFYFATISQVLECINFIFVLL